MTSPAGRRAGRPKGILTRGETVRCVLTLSPESAAKLRALAVQANGGNASLYMEGVIRSLPEPDAQE